MTNLMLTHVAIHVFGIHTVRYSIMKHFWD